MFASFVYPVTAAATGNNRHIIATDMLLPVSGALRDVLAVIAAGHLPDNVVFDVTDERRRP